jgi:hypothetical protein
MLSGKTYVDLDFKAYIKGFDTQSDNGAYNMLAEYTKVIAMLLQQKITQETIVQGQFSMKVNTVSVRLMKEEWRKEPNTTLISIDMECDIGFALGGNTYTTKKTFALFDLVCQDYKIYEELQHGPTSIVFFDAPINGLDNSSISIPLASTAYIEKLIEEMLRSPVLLTGRHMAGKFYKDMERLAYIRTHPSQTLMLYPALLAECNNSNYNVMNAFFTSKIPARQMRSAITQPPKKTSKLAALGIASSSRSIQKPKKPKQSKQKGGSEGTYIKLENTADAITYITERNKEEADQEAGTAYFDEVCTTVGGKNKRKTKTHKTHKTLADTVIEKLFKIKL